MRPYHEIPALAELLLEDSYILAAAASVDGSFRFDVEFRLLETHALWEPAEPGAAYCAKRGTLCMSGVTRLSWQFPTGPPGIDATGELDYGEFDTFEWENDTYIIEGNVGRIEIAAAAIDIAIRPYGL